MKTGTKIWLIVGALLVLLGCALFAVVIATLNWDFSGLATVKYVSNTYEVSEPFDSLSINAAVSDIAFVYSKDGKCTVTCREEENTKYSVAVENGTLTIKLIDERSVYDLIRLNFDSPKITIYLPKAEYTSLFIKGSVGDISMPEDFAFQQVDISLSTAAVDFHASASEMIRIKTSTGSIRVENISAGALNLNVTTGNVTVSGVTCQGDITVGVSTGKANLTDIRCQNVTSSGNTGDMILSNVIAGSKISIQRSTGSVKFEGSDAAEIFVKTDTGDVTGTLLSDKVFITQTDTGNVNVPKSAVGGRCEITTDTGDIVLNIS